MKNVVHGAVLALVLASPLVQAQAEKPLASERERVGYMVGMDVGRDATLQAAAADIDWDAFEQSLRRILAGEAPQLKLEQAQAISTALMQRVEARKAGNLQSAPAVSRQAVGELLGINVGRSLLPIAGELDTAAFVRGMRVMLEKGQPLLGEADVASIRQTLMARQQQRTEAAGEANRQKGEAFLAANRGNKGVVTTRSGLQYQVLRPGTGARPLPSSRVRVHYEGRLLDGKVFDSSYQRGEPTQFGLNQVIPGWSEGVGLMAVGAKYRFWIPGDLAYGSRGAPPNIGPNETLVFDVELIDIAQ